MPDGVMKRTPEEGRIVITLECKVDRKFWSMYSEQAKVTVTDAVDCLRIDVKNYESGELSLAELIDGADAISVTATK